jgi:hypothetical protein
MAATDLATILASWATTVEAAPLSLVPTVAPFTHDQQPGGMVANSYYFEDGGNVERTSVTNNAEVRRDRVTVWIAKPVNFAGPVTLRTMQTLIDDLYRNLLVLARANGYNVDADTRRVTHPPTGELLIASASFTVDFDFSSAVV